MDARVLLVDKPARITSHDLVVRVRRALGVRRVGHTGTLDPFATGLMLVCVGTATRIAEYLTGLDKWYDATALLGVSTDSHDCDGSVTGESDDWINLTETDIRAVAARFVGRFQQLPPALSAKKIGGERAHRLAREGKAPSLDPVEVSVHALTITRVALPVVQFRVHCGSGTYIRALARDLGIALGVGAHLTSLRRTAVGAFSVDQAVPLEALESGALSVHAAVPPSEALSHLVRIEVTEDEQRELAFGRSIVPMGADPAKQSDGPIMAVRDGQLLAIGGWREGRFQPRKVFAA